MWSTFLTAIEIQGYINLTEFVPVLYKKRENALIFYGTHAYTRN